MPAISTSQPNVRSFRSKVPSDLSVLCYISDILAKKNYDLIQFWPGFLFRV
jgi:hypothetical protein